MQEKRWLLLCEKPPHYCKFLLTSGAIRISSAYWASAAAGFAQSVMVNSWSHSSRTSIVLVGSCLAVVSKWRQIWSKGIGRFRFG